MCILPLVCNKLTKLDTQGTIELTLTTSHMTPLPSIDLVFHTYEAFIVKLLYVYVSGIM